MRKVLFVLILLGGGMDLAIPILHAQGTDSTTVVAVLLVQFANQDTCLDCRGSVGYSAPPTLDTVENKYRYGDYWNILFQPTGPVMHPDGDFPDNYSINGRGFDQYGSLRRYIADNSFGRHTVLPYRGWSAWSGLLNTVTPDSSGDPNRAIVDWLTLPYEKSSYVAIDHLADSAILLANRELAVDWDSLDVLIIWFAGVNPYGFARGTTFGKDTSIGVVHYVITSERAQNDSTGIPTFTYPRVTWHEFCHAAFEADDLHHRFPATKRGYFDVDASPEIELVRYMLYDEPAMPKRRARGARVVSRDGTLRIHPQPARGEIRFGIEAEGDGTAILFDLLGRKVIELPLAGDGTTIRGAMGLGSVSPGLYMLVVRTADMVRTGKVIVTR